MMGYAKLDMEFTAPVYQALARRVSNIINDFRSQNVSNCLWACAVMRWGSFPEKHIYKGSFPEKHIYKET